MPVNKDVEIKAMESFFIARAFQAKPQDWLDWLMYQYEFKPLNITCFLNRSQFNSFLTLNEGCQWIMAIHCSFSRIMAVDIYHWKYWTSSLYSMLGFWHNCTDRSKPNFEITMMSPHANEYPTSKSTSMYLLGCVCCQQKSNLAQVTFSVLGKNDQLHYFCSLRSHEIDILRSVS